VLVLNACALNAGDARGESEHYPLPAAVHDSQQGKSSQYRPEVHQDICEFYECHFAYDSVQGLPHFFTAYAEAAAHTVHDYVVHYYNML